VVVRGEPAFWALAALLVTVPLITAIVSVFGPKMLTMLHDDIELPRFVLTLLGSLCVLALWAWGPFRREGRVRVNLAVGLLAPLSLRPSLASTRVSRSWGSRSGWAGR
jgi:hypothetical protein